MTSPLPVTDDDARAIIREWGRLHDQQAGLSAFLPIIAEEGFYMQFGDKRWTGYADFEDHQITKRKFFDELHEYLEIRIVPPAVSGAQAGAVAADPTTTFAKTKMRWTYRYRPERSPTSKLIKAYLEHTWEFRRCRRTGLPIMQGHVVDLFEYEPGFRPDDQPAYDPHLDTSWKTR